MSQSDRIKQLQRELQDAKDNATEWYNSFYYLLDEKRMQQDSFLDKIATLEQQIGQYKQEYQSLFSVANKVDDSLKYEIEQLREENSILKQSRELTYNGWKNYATWFFYSYITDTPAIEKMVLNHATRIKSEYEPNNYQYVFASRLKLMFEDYFKPTIKGKHGMFYDQMLIVSLEDIDYGYIAERIYADNEL